MNLTKNFTLEELCYTTHSIQNIPSQHEKENLNKLCVNVLQPLRDFIGKSIHINSGFRNPILNHKVGGAVNSDHIFGYAADITLGNNEDNEKMYNWIKENCKYRQLINEHNFQWVHISYNDKDNKKQNLIIK